jgi:hypothetical protein
VAPIHSKILAYLCTEISGNAADKDNQLVGCVIDWYLSNPVKATELFSTNLSFFGLLGLDLKQMEQWLEIPGLK